jgi:hypothetical protein
VAGFDGFTEGALHEVWWLLKYAAAFYDSSLKFSWGAAARTLILKTALLILFSGAARAGIVSSSFFSHVYTYIQYCYFQVIPL